MRYQITYFERDESLCKIEIDRELPRILRAYWDKSRVLGAIKTEKNNWEELYRSISLTDGIQRFRCDRYTLWLYKPATFTWPDVIPNVLYSLNCHLAPEEKMEEISPPKTVPLDHWEYQKRQSQQKEKQA